MTARGLNDSSKMAIIVHLMFDKQCDENPLALDPCQLSALMPPNS